MKIDLEEPYKSLWKNGYLVINNQNRRNVCLVNDDSRTTVSYARYLMSVKLGYLVPDEYEVDHIDDDKTNDDINNLQLLTPEQNRLKEQYRYTTQDQISYGYECANCGVSFVLLKRVVQAKLAQNVEYAFCGRSCSTSFNYKIGKLGIGRKWK